MATLCGCVTARMGDDVAPEQLRAEAKAIVLLHTSLHEEWQGPGITQRCTSIEALLAQPDASGRYVKGDRVVLRSSWASADDRKLPSQIVLPAGDYGIVQLTCNMHRHTRNFNARVAQRGSILDGSGMIFEKPIASFKVGAGEVVDIGSLRLPSRTLPKQGFFSDPKFEFAAVVTPIPEPLLKSLEAANPRVFQSRIIRPMAGAARL